MQAFTEGHTEGHIATDIIITISGWACGLDQLVICTNTAQTQMAGPGSVDGVIPRRVGAPPKEVRNEKYPVDGPTGAGAGHALGAGCAWLWSCGGAGRPGVRRYLWRGVRSDNYRGDKKLAVRDNRGARDPRLA